GWRYVVAGGLGYLFHRGAAPGRVIRVRGRARRWCRWGLRPVVILTVVWLAAACDRNPKVAADPAAAAVAVMSLQQQAAQTVAARLSLAGDTLPPDLVAE